jgi:hypothetical protein
LLVNRLEKVGRVIPGWYAMNGSVKAETGGEAANGEGLRRVDGGKDDKGQELQTS